MPAKSGGSGAAMPSKAPLKCTRDAVTHDAKCERDVIRTCASWQPRRCPARGGAASASLRERRGRETEQQNNLHDSDFDSNDGARNVPTEKREREREREREKERERREREQNKNKGNVPTVQETTGLRFVTDNEAVYMVRG